MTDLATHPDSLPAQQAKYVVSGGSAGYFSIKAVQFLTDTYSEKGQRRHHLSHIDPE